MRRLRRLHSQQPAAEPAPATPLPPGRPAASPSSTPIATIQVICGPLVEQIAAAGMTVANTRSLLQGPFNIAAHAAALVDGRPVPADYQLTGGETLEFVRRSGEKGARQAAGPQLLIAADTVTLRQGKKTCLTAPVAAVVAQIRRAVGQAPSCGVLPEGVRLWQERGEATGVAIEIPPHARTVRWATNDPAASSWPCEAHYRDFFISFPYVVLLVIFTRGRLIGRQQLYYRRAPLTEGEDLLLPNLYNVANAYGMRCWVCLQALGTLGSSPWPAKIRAVTDHVFTAAFNHSAALSEGNSYWRSMPPADPRVASMEAWQDATRANPRFALEVNWPAAKTTANKELEKMLDHVAACRVPATATDLAGLLTRARRART